MDDNESTPSLATGPKGLEYQMTLIYDEYNDWWVWVDTDNHDTDLSPHFDYEEDAIQWHGRVSKHIFEEYGITKNENS